MTNKILRAFCQLAEQQHVDDGGMLLQNTLKAVNQLAGHL